MQLFLLSLGSLLSASEAAEHPQPKCLIDVDVQTLDELGCGLMVYAWANAGIYVASSALQSCTCVVRLCVKPAVLGMWHLSSQRY